MNDLTAIDILVEPDRGALDRAGAANAVMRTEYPAGFSLDDSHTPHISLLQRYVRTAALDGVFSAVASLLKSRWLHNLTFRAQRIRHMPVASIPGFGLAAIVATPCSDLIVTGEDTRITGITRRAMMCLVEQYRLLQDQILDLDRQVMACHRSSEASKRLATIPGVGPLAASALVASIGDASSFKNGRSFTAFIGLVPRQSSSGGKERLGKISKRGDHYLRWLLVVGSLVVIRYAQRHGTKRPWLIKLLQRRTTKIAAVAMANKIARIAWVLMTRGDVYREPAAQAA